MSVKKEDALELIDIYDINKKPTGKTAVRGTLLKKDEYRLVIHICVFNSLGQMLIQKRAMSKKGFPGKWDISVGGTVQASETSSIAASRELKEEIGIDFNFENQRPIVTSSFTNGFDDFYIIECDKKINSFEIQKEEVQKVMWADKKAVLSMIDSGKFIPYHKGFIEMLFDMRNDYGTIVGY